MRQGLGNWAPVLTVLIRYLSGFRGTDCDYCGRSAERAAAFSATSTVSTGSSKDLPAGCSTTRISAAAVSSWWFTLSGATPSAGEPAWLRQHFHNSPLSQHSDSYNSNIRSTTWLIYQLITGLSGGAAGRSSRCCCYARPLSTVRQSFEVAACSYCGSCRCQTGHLNPASRRLLAAVLAEAKRRLVPRRPSGTRVTPAAPPRQSPPPGHAAWAWPRRLKISSSAPWRGDLPSGEAGAACLSKDYLITAKLQSSLTCNYIARPVFRCINSEARYPHQPWPARWAVFREGGGVGPLSSCTREVMGTHE